MIKYVIKRILQLIPVIIIVSFIVFALMELAPGNAIESRLSGYVSEEEKEQMIAEYNLDKPMLYRFGLYMVNLVQGDLGKSYTTGANVWDMYMQRLPNTLVLALAGLFVGVVISVPLGVFVSRRAGTFVDTATTTVTLLGVSMPGFWIGLLLLILFSSTLGWFPAGGNEQGIRSLVLPAICSGFLLMASTTRQTRSSMLEVLKADYLSTARAKGVPERVVIRKHALGNAWVPIMTIIGTSLGFQLAGAVVVESVFSWPGVGLLTVTAVNSRDVPMVLGCVILTTVLYVILMLIVDLLYAFVDPRIKSQYQSGAKKKRKAAAVTSFTASTYTAEDMKDLREVYANEDAKWSVLSNVEENDENDQPVGFFASRTVKTDNAQRAAGNEEVKRKSQFAEMLHNLRRSRSAIVGLCLLGLIIVAFIISLFINFDSVTKTNVMSQFTAPCAQYPFGTDNLGRDMFLRVLYGTRYSLAIGIGATLVSALLGIVFGAIAGFYGGKIEMLVMRATDIVSSIPPMLLGMVIVVIIGQSLGTLILAVGLTSTPTFLRMARATTITVRGNDYVEAARAVGLSNLRIIFTQVLPNGLAPIIVTFSISTGMAIIVASSLSFLGFGVPVPTPEWGALISASRQYASTAPWLMIFPGLFIMITVLGFNLLGDGLRDALDPKMKK
ncbi:MAG: ABC transporter permease subunit [Lachnospiraceae bacterium]|nr:ABC transporter permease subunit [Lachnospiraceae bacterium]